MMDCHLNGKLEVCLLNHIIEWEFKFTVSEEPMQVVILAAAKSVLGGAAAEQETM